MRPKSVNHRAAELVDLGVKGGMDYEEIAELCHVSVGSVKRWKSTGRADGDAIRPLVDKVGSNRLPAEAVAKMLAEIYRARNKRYCIRAADLVQLAGRSRLRNAFLVELEDALDARRIALIPTFEGNESLYIVIKYSQLRKHVKDVLGQPDLDEYTRTQFREPEDEED